MKIEVAANLNKRFNFDFEKNIIYILKKIPEDHLFGLHEIQVLHSSPERHRRNARGFYYGKVHGEKFPRIVICAENVLDGLPSFLLKITFIPRVFLARTIFHEVAHHYQTARHGIKKHYWEKDANRYTKKIMNKYFRGELLLMKIIFGPFILLNRILRAKTPK